jgi:hypothetical protein
VTDLTVRALLALRAQFAPQIWSLMRYPGASRTHASLTFLNRIHIAFRSPAPAASPSTNTAGLAQVGHAAPPALPAPTYLSATQWQQLMGRIAALPAPSVSSKPSFAAVPDPTRPQTALR